MERSLITGLLSRREFLRLTGVAGAGLAAGCAVNPVTGRSQLMLLSEKDEIRIDKTYSPHQFSADYGEFQDRGLQDYLERTGRTLASRTHRPDMPYSFRCVNAPYVNAYAFPGGSIACTRGILVELGSEAELAGLLGHELGHVNARHTAEHMSKGMLASLAVSGLGMAVPGDGGGLGGLVSGLAGLGAGALLAAYSRDNEREADALGIEYMVRAGYSPVGMVWLMDMLRKSSERKPGALELMFSTHPMSEERYRTAKEAVEIKYSDARSLPVFRERFMDNTAGLRALKPAIEAMQEGDQAMAKKNYTRAEEFYRKALRTAPEDYAALLKMAESQAAQGRYTEARRYAESAREVYPEEPRSRYVSGIARIMTRDFHGAFEDFTAYEKRLPGNPTISFLKGYSLEGMSRIDGAAREYYRYLRSVSSGDQAAYAYKRLVDWGYIQPSKQ